MCQAKQKAERVINKLSKPGKASSKLEDKDLDDEEVDEYYVESSGIEGHLNICQLSNPTHKFLVNVKINGVSIAMEVDSGAGCSTI